MAAPEYPPPPLDHAGPWSEEDFFALPVDHRVELVDGSLVVSPSGSNRHSRLGLRVGAALDVASPAGWDVLENPNVRLGPDRILIPDVAVIACADMTATFNEATTVHLAVEIVSPGNAAVDRILKPRLYAEAGIARYLPVEWVADEPVGHLFALDDSGYGEIATGATIDLDEPFTVRLDLAAMVR